MASDDMEIWYPPGWNPGYLYLIKLYNLNTCVYEYKFGKTSREPYKRLSEHGVQNEVIFVMKVNNIDIESQILYVLHNDAGVQSARGNEYFLCANEKYITRLIIHYIDTYDSVKN